MAINYKKILNGLEERKMIPAEFAIFLALAGVRGASKTRLNESFRETNPVPLADSVADQVWNLWLELEEMHECLLPYRLDMTSGARTHSHLLHFRDAVRKGALQVLFNSCDSTQKPADNSQA